MKKLIYGVMLLCTAILCIDCKPKPTKPDEPTDVKLTISPATMKLAVGETSPRLSYVVTPNGTKVQISWESDNEEVATVNGQGIVTGVGFGTANITCTDATSKAKGTCVVTVASEVENLEYTEAYVGYKTHKDSVSGKDFPDIDSTVIKYYHPDLCKELGVDSLNAYTATMRVQLFSGIYFGSAGNLTGADKGAYIIGYSPAMLLPKELNPGLEQSTIISLGSFIVDTETTPTKEHHLEIGKLNNDTMMAYYPKFYADCNANEGKMTEVGYNFFATAQIFGTSGTIVKMVGFDAEKNEYAAYPNWLWKYIPNAIVTGGKFSFGTAKGSSQYMYKLDYVELNMREVMTDNFGIPGAYTDFTDPKNIKLLSNGWELGEEFKFQAGEMPQSAKYDEFGYVVLDQPIVMPSLEEDANIQATFDKFMKNNK